MKGMNRMIVNEATMMDIVQHYMEQVMFHETRMNMPKVTAVKMKDEVFEIMVMNEEQA